jgi:uncharacterized protein YuzE
MKVTYDKDADALYIQFNDKDVADACADSNNQLMIDYAADNSVVGIEVLNISQKVDMPLSFTTEQL